MSDVNRYDVTLVYCSSYYDGPVSGEARWNGQRYWFRQVEGEDPDSGLRELLKIPADQWQRLDERHALFQEHVGTHTDYDPVTQRRNLGQVKPGGLDAWRGFYDHPLAQPIEPTGTVVATFRLWHPDAER